MTWISYCQIFPKRWMSKNRIPKYILQGAGNVAVRVEFGFEIAWIVRDLNGAVLMPDLKFSPAKDFRLNTPGHVIGLMDMSSADGRAWANEWRAAFSDFRIGI